VTDFPTIDPPARVPLSNADLPSGYRLFGLRCGISAVSGKKDLALFLSDRPARAAGVFTRSLFAAAPVRWCRKKLAASAAARAVLINSGCANAATGRTGDRDAAESVKRASAALKIPAAQILPASTGVIGRPLPMKELSAGIAALAAAAGRDDGANAEDAVRAIMTTDTRPKAHRVQFTWKDEVFTVWACAKGAGMIHPNMATMLGVILTDFGLPAADLRKSLAWTAERTFNRVSIDGDTSTNDSLFLLSNGPERRWPPSARAAFRAALHDVCFSLSAQIAADGEGATRTAWIFVRGARTEKTAHALAATVATSPLVKTALHGADPNWGRVLAALGRAGVPFDPSRVEVRFGDVVVCKNGGRAEFSEDAVHELLKQPKVIIVIDLHQGSSGSHYVTCDYSKDYIAINADYTT
jgi:glutamate N-acetyltransferase/amino-acid N-acetyltransferase